MKMTETNFTGTSGFNLCYCPICQQMTNHKCLKCEANNKKTYVRI